jgi:hypothetical protein
MLLLGVHRKLKKVSVALLDRITRSPPDASMKGVSSGAILRISDWIASASQSRRNRLSNCCFVALLSTSRVVTPAESGMRE